jgi:hypothetical protein
MAAVAALLAARYAADRHDYELMGAIAALAAALLACLATYYVAIRHRPPVPRVNTTFAEPGREDGEA